MPDAEIRVGVKGTGDLQKQTDDVRKFRAEVEELQKKSVDPSRATTGERQQAIPGMITREDMTRAEMNHKQWLVMRRQQIRDELQVQRQALMEAESIERTRYGTSMFGLRLQGAAPGLMQAETMRHLQEMERFRTTRQQINFAQAQRLREAAVEEGGGGGGGGGLGAVVGGVVGRILPWVGAYFGARSLFNQFDRDRDTQTLMRRVATSREYMGMSPAEFRAQELRTPFMTYAESIPAVSTYVGLAGAQAFRRRGLMGPGGEPVEDRSMAEQGAMFGIGFGVGPQAGAQFFGGMARQGVFGDEAGQQRFAVRLSEAIVQGQMRGREGEVFQQLSQYLQTATQGTLQTAPMFQAMGFMGRLFDVAEPGQRAALQAGGGLAITSALERGFRGTEILPNIGRQMLSPLATMIGMQQGLGIFDIQESLQEGGPFGRVNPNREGSPTWLSALMQSPLTRGAMGRHMLAGMFGIGQAQARLLQRVGSIQGAPGLLEQLGEDSTREIFDPSRLTPARMNLITSELQRWQQEGHKPEEIGVLRERLLDITRPELTRQEKAQLELTGARNKLEDTVSELAQVVISAIAPAILKIADFTDKMRERLSMAAYKPTTILNKFGEPIMGGEDRATGGMVEELPPPNEAKRRPTDFWSRAGGLGPPPEDRSILGPPALAEGERWLKRHLSQLWSFFGSRESEGWRSGIPGVPPLPGLELPGEGAGGTGSRSWWKLQASRPWWWDNPEPMPPLGLDPAESIRRRTGIPSALGEPDTSVPRVTDPIRERFRRIQQGFSSWLKNLILSQAEASELPPELLSGVVAVESGGNPRAINRESGATGLGQVMPGMHGLSQDQLLDPVKNMRKTADILSQLLTKYGDLDKAIIAYGTGEGTLSKYEKGEISQERRANINRYVENVRTAMGVSQLTAQDFTRMHVTFDPVPIVLRDATGSVVGYGEAKPRIHEPPSDLVGATTSGAGH